MANRYFIMREGSAPNDGTRLVRYYLADTDAGKPVTGLNVGDLCWAVDTGALYVAISTTAWISIAKGDDATISLKYQSFYGYLGPGIIPHNVTWAFPDYYAKIVGAGDQGEPAASGQVAKITRTLQSAAIASTLLVNDRQPGLYRISYYLRCQTAGTGTGFVGVRIFSNDGVAAGITLDSASVQVSSTNNYAQGQFVVYQTDSPGDITYEVPLLSGTIGTSRYMVVIRCEHLG